MMIIDQLAYEYFIWRRKRSEILSTVSLKSSKLHLNLSLANNTFKTFENYSPVATLPPVLCDRNSLWSEAERDIRIALTLYCNHISLLKVIFKEFQPEHS